MWSCENLRPHQISRPPAGCAGASHPALHAEFPVDYGWFSKKRVPINDVRRSDKGRWTAPRVAPASPCCLPPAAQHSAARRRSGGRVFVRRSMVITSIIVLRLSASRLARIRSAGSHRRIYSNAASRA